MSNYLLYNLTFYYLEKIIRDNLITVASKYCNKRLSSNFGYDKCVHYLGNLNHKYKQAIFC